MRDLNQVNIIGRLTSDIEITYTTSGTPCAKFSIANNRDNGEKKKVNFINVETWGKIAEVCNQYLKKGSQVAISGEYDQQRWQDKTSGQTKSKVIINANQVQFLDSKGKVENQTNNFEDPWDEA
jgi:single-strand DNA-binding protein